MDNYQKLYYLNLFNKLNTLLPIITLFYLHRGLDMFDVFLLSVVYAVSLFLFEVPTGIIGDRFGRKASIILGCVFAVMHHSVYVFAHGFFMMAVGFVLMVISITFFSGSVEAFIYDSLKDQRKERQMNKYYGRYLSATNVSGIVMPFIAGFIAMDMVESQLLILLYIGLAGAVIAFFIALTLSEPEYHRKKKNSLELLLNSAKLLKTNKVFLRLALNKIFVFVLFVVYWRVWQPFFKEELLIPVILFGVFMSTKNLLMFLIKRNLESIENYFGIVRILRLTAIIPLFAAILFMFTENPIIHSILLFAILIPLSARDPLFSRYMNRHIKSENRATALSVVSLVKSMIEIPFMIFVGFIASKSLVMTLVPAMVFVLIGLTFFRLKAEHV